MGAFKAKLPRANPPICWGCDRKLHGGGRFYVLVEVAGVDGPRPFHKSCAPKPPRLDDPRMVDRVLAANGQGGRAL